jgi:hypothetical protein
MTIERPAIDKSTWGKGAWQREPDRVDFVHAGFACLLLRHPRHGHWCGYVGVPREHPLYGQNWTENDQIRALGVHMGVNYSAHCNGEICHVPAAGMPDDVWWLGCDFGQPFDFSPGLLAGRTDESANRMRARKVWDVYRTLPYVRHEIESLAGQLAAMFSGTIAC